MSENKVTVALEKRAPAGWIYFNRPERLNALVAESPREMLTILSRLEGDSQVRAAVFTGRGNAFCAGMEMAGMENNSPLAARRRSREMHMLTNRIAELSIPTIAAVNGVAMGAGLEICLACDLVVASTAARFAFPEVMLGMIPYGGGTQRLARLVGLSRAREMILTGKVLDADQALAWGLVCEVVQPDELMTMARELVEKIAQGGRFALFQAKRCLSRSVDMDINRGLEYELECFTTCFSTGEPSSGLKRFSGEKAEPKQGEPPAPQEPERPAFVRPPETIREVVREETPMPAATPQSGASETTPPAPEAEDQAQASGVRALEPRLASGPSQPPTETVRPQPRAAAPAAQAQPVRETPPPAQEPRREMAVPASEPRQELAEEEEDEDIWE